MQSASHQATTADSPVHPFSSVRVCNQTTPAAMEHLPYADILHFSHVLGNVEILASADVRDQRQYYWMKPCFHILQIKNQMQVRPIPSHSLSGNDALCAAATLHP